ncbi:hypothetical protein [Actinomycetospora termitidis]|uniref:Uncharacterized protein n=1 Tax=Actinomycetospora termitidis TaxID=3053470 RepID=A0ABT7MFJ8_9PSEU|nr:hypothetical protein [Actinomycetospora sp. Odt1-22]MDL5159439.1 hypothetical protein [Actinomycetospora sp. Odt1-22]
MTEIQRFGGQLYIEGTRNMVVKMPNSPVTVTRALTSPQAATLEEQGQELAELRAQVEGRPIAAAVVEDDGRVRLVDERARTVREFVALYGSESVDAALLACGFRRTEEWAVNKLGCPVARIASVR